MPLTEKGQEIKSALTKEYGEKKGEQVLYAGKNKGTFTGIDVELGMVTAPYFGRPGAATQLNYGASNPGYLGQPQVDTPAMPAPVPGMDATMAWGAPYDLSGGTEAPARGESASKEVMKASGLL
jgi:hypothetical protein